MEIIIVEDYEKACQEAAERIIKLVNEKPGAVLGLATGRTMIGVYRYLVKAYRKGRVDFSSVTTFNLDEYLGILPNHPLSFHSYMEEHFFKHVNIPPENIHIPSPVPEDIEEECENYERKIRDAGGIDLQLLGIGRDGHIGFNEPSSSLSSRTRVKTLAEETLMDNFPQGEGPVFAITMGLETIMEAKEIILIASGRAKAEAVAAAFEGPVTASVPASVLQFHPKVKVILDREAAGMLRRKDYYISVYRNKSRVRDTGYLAPNLVEVRAPARICLFGEHQDYLGLPVISAAVNLYMRIIAEKREDRTASFYLADFKTREEFPLDFPIPYLKDRDYLKSVFNVLHKKGVNFPWGINATVTSKIPINSGASSSSALVVALVKLLLEFSKDPRKDEPGAIARIAHEAEVLEFGEPGGRMDHYTCAMGGMLFIDFASGRVEKLRSFLSGLVLGDSLLPKDTTGILNRVKRGQWEAVQRLKEIYPDFNLLSTPYNEVRDVIDKLPPDLKPYAEAAVRNREITMHARQLLQGEGFRPEELGGLLLEHHRILRDLLNVSTPEIERMLEEAMKAGALGGKINGSGGGGTLFLYAPGRENHVKEALERLGKPAYIIEISDGVRIL